MRTILFFVCLLISANVFAQPSDAKVKSDAIGNGSGVIGFKFTKSTGTRQWNSSTGNWEYVRGVEVKRKSEYPGINLIVLEDVVYQYTGAGGYSFWKVRVVSNEYEGIPNPSSKEIDAIISTNWRKFYGYYYAVITKLWFDPTLADDPKWIWHNPNSVEFSMKTKFDHIIRGKGIETQEAVWKVRLYRDDPKSAWKNFIANKSQEDSDQKIVNMKTYTHAQLEDFQKQTLEFTMSEQKAKKDAAGLPQVSVPEFKTAEEMARFLHNTLRNGNEEKFRAVMLQVMSPGFFVDGSTVQLTTNEEQNLANVITAAYNNKATYKQMYCQNPDYKVEKWGGGSTKKTIYINAAVNDCRTMFIIAPVNAGYKEGVPQTKLKLLEYGIYVRQDADAISFINSFSDRKKLCASD